MIKAEDLRIGDLVIVNENCSLEQGTIGKVSEVRSTPLYKENEGSIGLKPISNDKWPWGVLCRNIDPIPLTPEILEKNGWKYISRKGLPWALFRKKGCSVRIAYDSKDDKVPFSVGKEIQELKNINYVHELQHILWVLGEDANLKI
uniref:Uncharacterized protein n=1 Tax=Siphoviridae sp. ctHiz26 TaxID=2825423 RepID=A0A8S5Q566_9CAUD|nr:MAG TPA: hypothetical protein [Siphoviridae sp. ctHiz26]